MLDAFREIWLADFEYGAAAGERPEVRCLVAKELRSGRLLQLWRDELTGRPPYATDPGALFVACYASAELGCQLSLGQPMLPVRVLDLFTEFRNRTNGLNVGHSLLAALAYFGLDGMDVAEKDEMRALALRGGPYTVAEKLALLDYCHGDVVALEALLGAMLPGIDLPRALLRGRFMAAAARIEHRGVPIDLPGLALLREHWEGTQDQLILEIDRDFGVFEGRTFKLARFEGWLEREGVPWLRLESGRLDLSREAFREVAKSNPRIAPLRELRTALSEMRLHALAVGADGRNRTMLSAFRARTGRNQPSNTKFIFGPSVWLRGLIKPPPAHGLAYVDWAQQEFGIAAALSGDAVMCAAYRSRDPYLAFARQAGAVPVDATAKSHPVQRQQFKACVLAVQYGMGPVALASRIGQPVIVARDLLRMHRETYARFWRWSDNVVDYAVLCGYLATVFGWTLHLGAETNHRALRNFPMQANGAEMMRLACCLATEDGVPLCAPVHDGFLICSPLDLLDDHVERMKAAMVEASRVVLDGFELATDVKVVRWPRRFMDKRGAVMWRRVNRMIHILRKERPHKDYRDLSPKSATVGCSNLQQFGARADA